MSTHEAENEWKPAIGSRYLAVSGRIWTVRSITPRGNRVVITCDLPDGEHGAVVDFTAVARMVALDAATHRHVRTALPRSGQATPVPARILRPPVPQMPIGR